MSEFFEQGAGIANHLRGVSLQVEALHAMDDIPQGSHVDTILAVATMGGEHGHSVLRGDQGSGKSTLAKSIIGSRNFVQLGRNDTRETLFGTEKQLADGVTSGSIGRILLNDVEYVSVVLDEIGDIEDVRAIHALSSDEIYIQNGLTRVDIENFTTIATTNNPKLNLVNDLPKETRDRFAGYGVFASDLEYPQRESKPGLIPPAKVRKEIREYAGTRYPADKEAIKHRTKQIVAEMDKTQMFDPHYRPQGARPIGGLVQAVRANKLVLVSYNESDSKISMPKSETIQGDDLTSVAAYSLGLRAELTADAVKQFARELGVLKLEPHVQSVIKNRLIAAVAKKVELIEADPILLSKTLSMQNKSFEELVKGNMDSNSFATLGGWLEGEVSPGVKRIDKVDEKILKLVFDKQEEVNLAKTEESKDGKPGIFRRTVSRFYSK